MPLILIKPLVIEELPAECDAAVEVILGTYRAAPEFIKINTDFIVMQEIVALPVICSYNYERTLKMWTKTLKIEMSNGRKFYLVDTATCSKFLNIDEPVVSIPFLTETGFFYDDDGKLQETKELESLPFRQQQLIKTKAREENQELRS